MNQSTPTSLQSKIKHIKQTIDQLYIKVLNKQDKTQQLLRINFISFLDESIQKLQLLTSNQPATFNIFSENLYPSNSKSQAQQYKERYFQSERERIHLQKKLTQLLEKQIREQQHALKLQRAESQSLKEKSRLESQIRQLNQTIQQLQNELNNHSIKTRDQEREIHRLVTLNHRLNDEREKLVENRNRAQRKVNELQQKYQQEDQLAMHAKSMKGHEKFSLKNTEGIRNVRILTNVSNQKKNSEKYFILQLPAKLQLQKIVYGIRLGMIMSNKEIVYFNDLQLYEKDPMRLELQGDSLAIDYLKRREKVIFDKQKMTKPQVLVLLYGKGDSVMIDETK